MDVNIKIIFFRDVAQCRNAIREIIGCLNQDHHCGFTMKILV
jgi:hypothetical protein